jgi:hypothetical protein
MSIQVIEKTTDIQLSTTKGRRKAGLLLWKLPILRAGQNL